MAVPKFIKKAEPTPTLSMDVLAKLDTIFHDKQWSIDKTGDVPLYDRFCSTLLQFSLEEQTLFLELTTRFLKIGIDEYVSYLEDLLFKIQTDNPNCSIILAPCLPEADSGSVKSAGVALYMMRTTHYKRKVKCSIELNDIKNVITAIKENTIVVLVDDFIGTGETALSAIGYALSILPEDFSHDRIKVMSIVTMKHGQEQIEKLGVKVYTSYLNEKGISDYYSGDTLQQNIDLMKSIESKLAVKPKFQFGYGRSEALVCMSRCPNNTFPVYWLGKNKAPYER